MPIFGVTVNIPWKTASTVDYKIANKELGSNEDSEVLEHRFFSKDEIPKDELFAPDARPILDWAKGGNHSLLQ